MKPGVALLRAVALVCTGLALTACGGVMTEEEAAAMEAEALASQEAEVGSCANWSEWTSTGNTFCAETAICGHYWECPPWGRQGDTTASARAEGEGESYIPTCPGGAEPIRYIKWGTYEQRSSYRVCFDEYGNYTHTEYQYSNVRTSCSC